MLKRPFPVRANFVCVRQASSQRPILPGFLLFVALVAVAAMGACGGGSSNSSNTEGGGGGGTSTNNVCSNCGVYSSTPYTPTGQPNPYFGMHLHSQSASTPWPSTVPLTDPPDASGFNVDFGGIRLWDSGTGWAEMNSAPGTYDFKHMDGWIQEAEANNVDILYNLARTPTWASSNPTDSTCDYASISGGSGQCYPPSDVNKDGSGSDSIWIGWVTSVVNRYKGQIKYYEIWNEWNINLFWRGNASQLARMTEDAYCVIKGAPSGASCNSNSTFPDGTGLDPSAEVLTPSAVGSGTNLYGAQNGTANLLGASVSGTTANVGNFSDDVGFHCYVSEPSGAGYPVPENVLTVLTDLNQAVTGSALQDKPLFCTEGGWGEAPTENFTDPSLQAAFLARYYLLQYPLGVSRVYWYAWDAGASSSGSAASTGALWTSSSGPSPAATAYAEVYNWIAGSGTPATPTPCAGSLNGIYTCALTRTGGYSALAVWDSNQAGSCYAAGTPPCGTTFTVPAGYAYSRDLAGNETPVTAGSSIALTAQPILLETAPLP